LLVAAKGYLKEGDTTALHEEEGDQGVTRGLNGQGIVVLVVLGLKERTIEFVPHPVKAQLGRALMTS
jgi:hypothetical protein